jgi:hypothetical protein
MNLWPTVLLLKLNMFFIFPHSHASEEIQRRTCLWTYPRNHLPQASLYARLGLLLGWTLVRLSSLNGKHRCVTHSDVGMMSLNGENTPSQGQGPVYVFVLIWWCDQSFASYSWRWCELLLNLFDVRLVDCASGRDVVCRPLSNLIYTTFVCSQIVVTNC